VALRQRFNRTVSSAVLNALRRQPLFNRRLLPDMHHRDWKKPAVVGQLHRYNRILGAAGKSDELLAAYRDYVDVVNDFCVASSLARLPHPQEVEETVVLFVFGYDRGQEARMKKLLITDDSLKGHRLRTRGSTAQFSASALWKRVRSME
jgi:hypothetical protein